MKKQDAKREAVLQQWREMIYARCSSGHTVAGWCREHSVPVAPYCRRQELVWTQESEKLSEKSIGMQMIQAKESQLTPMNFEAIPYCDPLQAEPAEASQIILCKGEWRMEI